MKISFTTMATPELSVFEAINAAKQYGFDAIDLRMRKKGGEIDQNLSADEAEKIKNALGNTALSSLLCYNKMIAQGCEEMAASIAACMNTAKLLGASAIRIFTGRIQITDELTDAAKAISQALRACPEGPCVYVQNHKNNGVSVRQAYKMAELIDSSRFGLVYSPEQEVMAGRDLENDLAIASETCRQLYVADIDKEHNFVLHGRGIIPFDRIYETLSAAGFRGYVTLKWEKCHIESLPTYDEAFKAFLEWAKGF